jgi:hypothetical protein
MLTQDALDDEDFPLEEIPSTELADLLDDPSHPDLAPRHPEDEEG